MTLAACATWPPAYGWPRAQMGLVDDDRDGDRLLGGHWPRAVACGRARRRIPGPRLPGRRRTGTVREDLHRADLLDGDRPAACRLRLPTGFAGPGDRRLRAFAADCAEHALPAREDARRNVHALVTRVIQHARERADCELRGWQLKAAFGGAGSTLTRTTDNLTHLRGDPATLELVDDAAAAAYCAVCAPTPLEAAASAANCASVTADGALRDGEHRWQLQRLNWYRRQGANPA